MPSSFSSRRYPTRTHASWHSSAHRLKPSTSQRGSRSESRALSSNASILLFWHPILSTVSKPFGGEVFRPLYGCKLAVHTRAPAVLRAVFVAGVFTNRDTHRAPTQGAPPDPHRPHKVWMAAVDRPVLAAIQYSPAGYHTSTLEILRHTHEVRPTPPVARPRVKPCNVPHHDVPARRIAIGPPIACISVHRPLFTDKRPLFTDHCSQTSGHQSSSTYRSAECALMLVSLLCDNIRPSSDELRPSSDRAQTELRPSSGRAQAELKPSSDRAQGSSPALNRLRIMFSSCTRSITFFTADEP